MKLSLCAILSACAIILISLGFTATSAYAKMNPSKQVRIAQDRLIGLGYSIGRDDGVIGPLTADALMDFQDRSGLQATGKLDPETYSALQKTYYSSHLRSYDRYNGYYRQESYYNSLPWNEREYVSITRFVPIRHANLAIHEEHRGSVSNYSVTLNGAPVINAYNQSAPVRISKNYNTKGEDEVVFTVADASSICNYKNLLLTVHQDGTYSTPVGIDNCGMVNN